jgi:HAD superfamily phosphatase
MKSGSLWQREDLRLPRPFDSMFFDVDGVLIKTIDSFHEADVEVAEYVVREIQGLHVGDDASGPLITLDDVALFKQAGGYNNNWDLCYLLASLFTAKLREWRGTSLAERSTREWAEISRAANARGHGGLAWVKETIPDSARPDYAMLGDLYHECYWGADETRKRFGHEPRYFPGAEGLVHREEMLYTPDFPRRLRAAGVQHLGMITGRAGPEVDSALESMLAYSGEQWWEVVISASEYAKPDPQALRAAIGAVGARGGLYIGDTADDHDLVRNYYATKSAGEPDMVAAMMVEESERETYIQRGADVVVRSVEELMGWLASQI